MPAGLTVLALFAQAATAQVGPAAPEQKKAVTTPTAPACPKAADPNSNQIIICAPRTEGYRLNPDVLEARREMRNPGRPKRGGPDLAPYRECTVGPMGCGPQAGINLLAAALTAAEMAKRLSEGKEIGSMFKTDPTPSEYQLYQAAKERREAEEAEKAGKAAAAAAKAKAEAKTEAAKSAPAE
jgi:hypothetical protein